MQLAGNDQKGGTNKVNYICRGGEGRGEGEEGKKGGEECREGRMGERERGKRKIVARKVGCEGKEG